MESMDVAKEPAVKMTGEDLAHAYDAVRVANKSVRFPYLFHFVDTFPLQSYAIIHVCVCVCFRFLESQLRGQRSQQDEELKALQLQLSQAVSGSSSGAQRQVSIYCVIHLQCIREQMNDHVKKWVNE